MLLLCGFLIILPSLATGCCLPDTMSAVQVYDYSSDTYSDIVVDFTKKKYMVTRHTGDVKWFLSDMETSKTYWKYQNDTCKEKDLFFRIEKCATNNAASTDHYKIGTKDVSRYTMNLSNNKKRVMTMFTDPCLPVYNIHIKPGSIYTEFYLNITSPLSDTSSLDRDVSSCTAA